MLTILCLSFLFGNFTRGTGFGMPNCVLLPLIMLAGVLLQMVLLRGGKKWLLPIMLCAGLILCELLGAIIGGYFLLILVIIVTYLLTALLGVGIGATVYQGIKRSHNNMRRNIND